jgi:hypothetical protein
MSEAQQTRRPGLARSALVSDAGAGASADNRQSAEIESGARIVHSYLSPGSNVPGSFVTTIDLDQTLCSLAHCSAPKATTYRERRRGQLQDSLISVDWSLFDRATPSTARSPALIGPGARAGTGARTRRPLLQARRTATRMSERSPARMERASRACP